MSVEWIFGSTSSLSHTIMSFLNDRFMYLFSKVVLKFPHEYPSGSWPEEERYIINIFCSQYRKGEKTFCRSGSFPLPQPVTAQCSVYGIQVLFLTPPRPPTLTQQRHKTRMDIHLAIKNQSAFSTHPDYSNIFSRDLQASSRRPHS